MMNRSLATLFLLIISPFLSFAEEKEITFPDLNMPIEEFVPGEVILNEAGAVPTQDDDSIKPVENQQDQQLEKFIQEKRLELKNKQNADEEAKKKIVKKNEIEIEPEILGVKPKIPEKTDYEKLMQEKLAKRLESINKFMSLNYKTSPKLDRSLYSNADSVENSHLNFSRYSIHDFFKMALEAVENDELSSIKILIKKNPELLENPWYDRIYDAAKNDGHVAILKFLEIKKMGPMED